MLAPWADVLYFADYRWWEWHKDRSEYRAFNGERVTIQNTGGMVSDPAVHMLHNHGTDALCEKENGLHTGCNGGYQAVNLAYLTGAKRILLIGYDMHFPQGRTHWHKGHPIRTPETHYTATYARMFYKMLPQLEKSGVKVINCTEGSIIKCFPFSTIEKELA